jgi:ABC-2 type transport system permease protein
VAGGVRPAPGPEVGWGELVRTLTAMRLTMLRHMPKGQRPLGWVIGAVLVAATWAAVLLAREGTVRAELLLLVLAAWGVGSALGPVTMSGPGVLRGDQLALLPVSRGRLATGLLVATFPGIASGYVLLAALSPLALVASPLAAVVAVVAGVLTWALMITSSRLVFGVLGSLMRTRLGVEISALQFGVIISVLLAGWMVVSTAVSTVPDLLRDGLPDGPVVDVLRVLPTGWAVGAVEAASDGDTGVALLLVGALLALVLVLGALAAVVLRPSLGSRRTQRRRRPLGSRVLTGRPLLPDSPLGAVVGKELRQWWRDPWRGLEVRTAVYTGLLTGALALASVEYQALAPLAGLVIAFMVGLGACNLYGQDGSAVWLTVVGETRTTAREEVLGRSLALLVLYGPSTVVISVLLVVVGGAHWAWPLVLAALPALLGVSIAVAVTVSSVAVSPGVDPRRRVGPNDAGGDLGLQAQVAFWGALVLVLPTAAATGWAYAAGTPWLAVPAGVLNGVLVWWALSRLTTAFLRPRLVGTFMRIRYGVRDDLTAAGPLGWLETSSHDYEAKVRADKEKHRRSRRVTASR